MQCVIDIFLICVNTNSLIDICPFCCCIKPKKVMCVWTHVRRWVGERNGEKRNPAEGCVCHVNGDDDSNKMGVLMVMKAIKECVK